MTGEKIVTVSADGFTSVEIWTTKLDHNLDKPIISINMPNFGGDMDSQTEPTTRNIDLGRVKEIVTIIGFLPDDSSYSGLTKKENLLKLVKFSRTVTITWGTDTTVAPTGGGTSSNKQTVTGNIIKVGITETAGKLGEQGPTLGDSGEKGFAVQLALVIGEDTIG